MEEKKKTILKKLRESIRLISDGSTFDDSSSDSESEDMSTENGPENALGQLPLHNVNEEVISTDELTRDREVEKLIECMRKRGGPVAKWLTKLTPCSMRDIVRESLAKVDNAEIAVKIERAQRRGVTRRTKREILCDETYWLFPFDSRKLVDLPEDIFDQISMHLTDELPKENQIWVRLIQQLFSSRDALKLEKDIKGQQLLNPYIEILCEYAQENRGKTLGELLEGLRKFSDKCSSYREVIDNYIREVERLRQEVYETILENLENFSVSITTEEFEMYHRNFNLKAKTNITRRLNDLRGQLTPGDMLWMMRKGKTHHKSYAHVGIISEIDHCIHVTTRNKREAAIAKAVINEDHFDNLHNVENCFVVSPPPLPPNVDPSIYQKRAKACKDIRFDYDALTSQCETFCQYVHGNWTGNFQIPRGVGQQGLNAYLKGSTFIRPMDEPLKDQMKQRFISQRLILPDERFLPDE